MTGYRRPGQAEGPDIEAIIEGFTRRRQRSSDAPRLGCLPHELDGPPPTCPSFAGRTVIVTGANSGLGEVTARELARVGARSILAVRNTDKGDDGRGAA